MTHSFKKFLKGHFDFYHLILFLVLTLTLFFYFLPPFVSLQKDIIIFTSFFYFAWSLFYHFQKKDLSAPLILEYLLFILLALFLFFTTLARS